MKKNKKIKIKVLQETPDFYGIDMKKYGPFKPSQIIELPPEVGKTFIEKKLGKQLGTIKKTGQKRKKEFLALQKRLFKNPKVPQLHFIAYSEKNGDVIFEHIHNDGYNTLEMIGITGLFKNDLLEKQKQKDSIKDFNLVTRGLKGKTKW